MGLVDCSFHVYPVKEKKNLASLYLLAGFRKCYSLGGEQKKIPFVCMCCCVFFKRSTLLCASLELEQIGIPDIFIWAS